MAQPAPFPRLGHVAGFDGLRAIAVLLVVSSHFSILLYGDRGTISWLSLESGWLGVDLFFALSGFLITSLLLTEQNDHGRVDTLYFYGRRAVRLLPALLAMLVAHVIYTAASRSGDMHVEMSTVLYSLLYIENWHVALNPLGTAFELGHVWSLGVEEQFYLLWPITIAFLARRFRSRWVVPSLLVGLAAVMTVHRFQLFSPQLWLASLVRTDTRPTAMVLGAAAAWLWSRRIVPSKFLVTALPVALVAMAVVIADPIERAMRVVLVASIAAPIIVLAVVEGSSPLVKLFEWAPLRAIGRVSYGIYIWHHPVFWIVLRHAGSSPVAVRFLLGIGASAVLTLLSWFLLEQPISRRFRSRFVPHRSVTYEVPAKSGFIEIT
jgi:peptidoglycan/LPS O-acetylase OafA/YrhL